MSWHKVAKTSDIEPGKAQTLEIGGKQIALFNLGQSFHAIANRCAHRGGPLAEGHTEGDVVTCPWHAWEFHVKTGNCRTDANAKQETFRVKVEGDDVFVEV